jgi:hypothetical protein
MNVYIVIQEGVYRHRISGASETLDGAKEIALKAILEEGDHYHDQVVVLISTNPGIAEMVVGRYTWRRGPYETFVHTLSTEEERLEAKLAIRFPGSVRSDRRREMHSTAWRVSGEAHWEKAP